jgi:hypothetical protein
VAALVASGLGAATACAAAEPVNAILPTADGCLVMAGAPAGSVHAACPSGARLHRDPAAPDGAPAALAEAADGRVLLGTTAGLFEAATAGAPWRRLSDRPVAGLGCGGARCVVRFWGAMPDWLTAGGLEPVPT